MVANRGVVWRNPIPGLWGAPDFFDPTPSCATGLRAFVRRNSGSVGTDTTNFRDRGPPPRVGGEAGLYKKNDTRWVAHGSGRVTVRIRPCFRWSRVRLCHLTSKPVKQGVGPHVGQRALVSSVEGARVVGHRAPTFSGKRVCQRFPLASPRPRSFPDTGLLSPYTTTPPSGK